MGEISFADVQRDSGAVRVLHKHSLLFDQAFAFCKEALEGTNTFSSEASKVISREAGHFFTLLPDNANIENLHQFSWSILVPEPHKTGPVGSLPGIYTYSPIASLEPEFAAFLYDKIHAHAYQFMSDDFNGTYKAKKTHKGFNLYGAHYLEEVYYFVSPQEATRQSIEQCLSYSTTFWHSLCILSSDHIAAKTLQLSDMQRFCQSAQLILIGAYDGDGYIVWQRKAP